MMSQNLARRLSSSGSQEMEDLTLDSLDRSLRDEAASFRDDVPQREPDDPFDLEVAKPHAVGIERLYRVLGKKVPAQVRASLGAAVPVLLAHGMTPFYKPGLKPTGVWGMGYRCEVDEQRCATVVLFPASRKYDVIEVAQRLSFGLKAGGEIGVPEEHGLQLVGGPVAVELAGTVHATTDQEFAVAVQCSFSVPPFLR